VAAADPGYYSQDQEKAAQARGVKICVGTQPQHAQCRTPENWRSVVGSRTVSGWRTGSEGRISALKRRHGLDRCRYRGWDGFQRWVGLGVMADNLIQIGRCLALKTT